MNYKCKLLVILLIIPLLFFPAACSYPNSKLASVSINATVVDANGIALANKKVEVTLPASYGMKEIDYEYSEPEELGKTEQTIVVKTDATGTFTHTFEPVTYNTAYWFFPPLGNFPKEPPNPSFVLRMIDSSQNVVYSIGWNENEELNYAVQRSERTSRARPPYFITGKILREDRGEIPACIANFNFKKSN